MPLKPDPAHRPFEVLKGLVDRGKVRLAPRSDKPVMSAPKLDGGVSDEEAFRQAMEEVRPLGWSEAPLTIPGPVEAPRRANDEAEALAQLQTLVEGHGELDPFLTGEGVEGASTRPGRLHLPRLKKGGYSVQAHLDLHGLTLTEAKKRFEAFMHEAQRQGYGCVRIVHGRGTHSPAEPAALKTHLTRWLLSRKMGRSVVAFASARWKDGGSGAVYVLLYRRRRPPKT